MPEALAASVRDTPSNTSAIARSRRACAASLVRDAASRNADTECSVRLIATAISPSERVHSKGIRFRTKKESHTRVTCSGRWYNAEVAEVAQRAEVSRAH